jgi:hypothetical protein
MTGGCGGAGDRTFGAALLAKSTQPRRSSFHLTMNDTCSTPVGEHLFHRYLHRAGNRPAVLFPSAHGLPATSAHPQRLGQPVLGQAEGFAGCAEVSGGHSTDGNSEREDAVAS